MAENLAKKPAKGILKASSSFDHCEANKNVPDIKWDEMNILQTLHPPDKDYGHMKIDEPKTPYSYYSDGNEVSEKGCDTLDADLLAQKIISSSEEAPKSLRTSVSDDEEEEEEEDDEYAHETEEERAQRKAFEYKRKMHYNEYYAVKLARKLIEKDEDEDDEEDTDEKNGKDSAGESGEKTAADEK